jgi:hypothetical protein
MFKYNYVPVDKLDQKTPSILLEPGQGKFTIKAFYDKDKNELPLKTSDGTPKINLLLEVVDFKQAKSTIYDTITSNMPWKIKQLGDALAMGGLYNESGVIDFSKLIGYSGHCMIKTQASDKYGSKSVIEKYISWQTGEAAHVDNTPSQVDDRFIDDDVPF